MLIIGELRDLRDNKGSTELSAASLEIPVSGMKQNVSNQIKTYSSSSTIINCSTY